MKVLIISHTCLNTHNNMGKTLLSMFSSFEREELCQLYIYPMKPDVKRCSSYYRITDKDVLKSYLKFRVFGKEIVSEDINEEQHELFENTSDEKLYRNKKNKTALRGLLRDVMWKFSRWYNSDVKMWIKRERPTCIFVAPGMPVFLYEIAMKIADDCNLPLIVYICDDYYFMKNKERVLEKMQMNLFRKKTRRLFERASKVVGICEEISKRYGEEFRVPGVTVMTGTKFCIASEAKKCVQPYKLTYMGNIRYDRYNMLAEIGRALDEINREKDMHCELHIYTIEKDVNVLQTFEDISSVKLCGFVSGKEFDEAFFDSDILIHTESFEDQFVDLTRNSVSTKIADSLASGIPLFAYGPSEIASMQHLIKNDCAIVASDKSELKDKLYLALTSEDKREECVLNALETARKYHNKREQSEKLRKILGEICNESITD